MLRSVSLCVGGDGMDILMFGYSCGSAEIGIIICA